MRNVRCPSCLRLWFRAFNNAIRGRVEIRCPRCKGDFLLTATSRPPERLRAPQDAPNGRQDDG